LRLIEKGEGVVELGQHRLSTIGGIALWRCGEPTINIRNIIWNKQVPEFERLEAHIKLNKPFCLLALREEEYYKNKVNLERNDEAGDAFMKRNARFDDFIPAIKSLIETGIQVIKVGNSGKRANLQLRGFYDFCGEGYCPEVDVYLAMNCRFLISGSCGYTYQCTVFNKPVFTTHVYSHKTYINGSHGIFYPSVITRAGSALPLSKSVLVNIKDSDIDYVHPSALELRDAIMEYYSEFLEDYENKRGVCFDMGALHSARISASLAFVSPSWIRHNSNLVDI
jgi:putative glycosyltransferase (TIGR04372 family)